MRWNRSDVLVAYTELLSLRDAVHLAGVELVLPRQYRIQLHRRVQASRQELISALGSSTEPVNLEERRLRLQGDESALNAQTVEQAKLHQRLCKLESSQHRHEHVFFESLMENVHKTGIWTSAKFDLLWMLRGLTSTSHSDTSSSLEPLLENFYDNAANVAQIVEESAKLDSEHRRATVSRNVNLDRGVELSITKHDFENEHTARRCAIDKRLSHAVEATENAKRACLSAAVDHQGAQSRSRQLDREFGLLDEICNDALDHKLIDGNHRYISPPPSVPQCQQDLTDEILSRESSIEDLLALGGGPAGRSRDVSSRVMEWREEVESVLSSRPT